ncbi:MAG: 50S ribosomal protein L4 [Candidatus Latescibacterota bacterium]|nr:50S ribosomal protein L4 [Candidatus Latescibacterota bacterium]
MATQVEVLGIDGKPTGSVELSDELFAVEVSEYAIYRAVVAYEANQRQGTAKVKTRSEVSLTSKKHHRQKGTGGARRGSNRSPLIRGGGVAFGPQPRSYNIRLPKSLKRLAFRSALTVKCSNDQIKIVDDFDFERPSTKSFQGVLNACGLVGPKVLFVTPEKVSVLVQSSGNLRHVKTTHVGSLGAYDVIASDIVLFTRHAMDRLNEHHVIGVEELAGV